MKKINVADIKELDWGKTTQRFRGFGKPVSEELGRKPESTDLLERHPFDVEILRVPPGKANYPFHSHSAQWEFYHVISGSGIARDDEGEHEIVSDDAFIYKPGEAHQIINTGSVDLIVYVIADNPVGETCYYPDSDKWLVRSPENKIIRSESLDYYDGEDD